jgi:methionine sulfoxide reductase heme-binding subunit
LARNRLFPIWLGIALAALALFAGWGWGADLQQQWQLSARYTARVGFPLLLIAYVASSLARLWPGEASATILRHRRQWGLAFAFTHSVHLIALTGFNMIAGRTPEAITLAGGGGAYAILYAMALTSNTASQRAMGIWWHRLHTLGIHWLWFIFAFSYFGRMMSPDQRIEGTLFFALCLAALSLRIAAWRNRISARG